MGKGKTEVSVTSTITGKHKTIVRAQQQQRAPRPGVLTICTPCMMHDTDAYINLNVLIVYVVLHYHSTQDCANI